MSVSKQMKVRFKPNRQNSIVIGAIVALVILVFSPDVQATSSGTTSKLPGLELPFSSSATPNSSQIVTEEVWLDGRKLFSIATPAVTSDSKQNNVTPIKERVAGIETTLERIIQSNFDSKTLRVTSEIDQSSGLPVISVNNQYLMTVTTLDAQLQGREPSRQADELTRIIKSALVEAKSERQPETLTRQSLLTSEIIVAILLISWGVSRIQNRLKLQQQEIRAQRLADPEIFPNTTDIDSKAAVVQQQLTRQQRSLNDVQRRLLQLLQIGLWGGSIFAILGLFPYTRSLQPLVLSGPLRVLAIVLATYVVIRVIDVLIDRFLGVIEAENILNPEVSQRLALRISTFSRVLKSVSAILCVGTAAISILSVVGVQLGPVLAGAGIIGLALSFASQSLVKDMINGLLILFEDQYAVGDVIAVGKVAGLVEYMNLRITQLRNDEGRLITIPNSAISTVENLSKDWSRVDLGIMIAYDADMNQAIEVIKEVGLQMLYDPAWHLQILEPPEVLGIDDIGNSGITIRVWIKTQPLQQWNVAREFRRRLKLALDDKGISIGVPQQSLWFRSSPDLNHKILDATDEQVQIDSPTDGKGLTRSPGSTLEPPKEK